MSKLTPKQEKFCNLYIEGGNASKAYRQSYDYGKMSDETINRKAIELLHNGKITARVKELQEALQKRSDITKDEAVRELTNMAMADVLDFVGIEEDFAIEQDEDGGITGGKKQTVVIKDLSKLTPEQRRCIKSITPVRGGVKLELCSKEKAWEMLTKMHGWEAPVKTAQTDKEGNDVPNILQIVDKTGLFGK